ncbi:MAG: hypothetical protein NUW01_08805 [Gemmatimonadaceae bacterium]|nr:hypothetical protein [Gemmatimonadaceae bacterium]
MNMLTPEQAAAIRNHAHGHRDRHGDLYGLCADVDALLADRDELARRHAADQDAALDDLRAILRALGLGDHARAKSPHEVVSSEVIPAIDTLVRRLAKVREWALGPWYSGLSACGICEMTVAEEDERHATDCPAAEV